MTFQEDLVHPGTRARTTDPDTSFSAAERIHGRLGLLQRRVLALFDLPEFCCDESGDDPPSGTHDMLIAAYRRIYGPDVRESTVRTRVSELVILGLVEDTRCRIKGKALWGLTTDGVKAIAALRTP